MSLDKETIRNAKTLAARHSTTIGDLLARQIDTLAGAEELYEHAKQQAMVLLDSGFHLGYGGHSNRDELHDR